MIGFASLVASAVIGASSAPAPTLASANYSQGDIAGGGQAIVLTGTNMAAVTTVTILGTSVSPTSTTTTTVTFPLPAHAAGTGTVSVTSPGGTSSTLPFEFWSPSQVTGVDAYLDANKGVTLGTGSKVTAWLDQSSNARSFANAANDATCPNQTASVFGALPSIRYVPSQRVKLGASVAQLSGSSMFFVGAWTSADATEAQTGVNAPLTLIGDSVGGPNMNVGALAGALANGSYNGTSWAVAGRGTGLNDGVARLCGWTYNSSTLDKAAYVGATQQGAIANRGGTYSQQFNSIGAGYLDSDGWDGDVGAVIIIAQVIAAGDLTKLNKWAQQRFATT